MKAVSLRSIHSGQSLREPLAPGVLYELAAERLTIDVKAQVPSTPVERS